MKRSEIIFNIFVHSLQVIDYFYKSRRIIFYKESIQLRELLSETTQSFGDENKMYIFFTKST
jgi:hypothetical protein